MKIYRDLSPEKIIEFQKWVRENYKPFSPIVGAWHPVIQRECVQMNEEEARKMFVKHEEFLKTHLQTTSQTYEGVPNNTGNDSKRSSPGRQEEQARQSRRGTPNHGCFCDWGASGQENRGCKARPGHSNACTRLGLRGPRS
jgi:hypothetical protein